MIRKFSASRTSEYPWMKSLPLFFNVICLHRDALSPSLFQFAYHFKIEFFILVPQVLIYCIHDTFVASEISTTKVSFQLLGTYRSQKGLNLENTGIRKDFVAAFSRSSHGNLWCVSTCIKSCKSRTPRVSFLLLFLAISWNSRLSSSA